MSRPIEFRAWSKKYHKYIEPSNFVIDSNGKPRFLSYEDTMSSIDLGKLILEQYTGLKDKKGVKIFENDILKYEDVFTLTGEPSNIYYLAVDYSKYAEWEAGMYLLNKIYKHTEVMSTTHQNKALLKG